MQRFVLQESLFIKHLELDQWLTPDRLLDWYEIIQIQTGEGYHVVNDNRFAYHPGDVFFLGGHDRYSFLITKKTSFYRLAFSKSYVDSLLTTDSHSWGFNPAASPCVESIAADATDQDKLRTLIAMLLSEERSLRSSTDNPIVKSLMTVILSMVDRLLAQRGASAPARHAYSSDLTRRVINYISQHIGEPDRLRMDILADTFNYSPGHLSALFKQQVGDSIQQFIIRHKLKLVATRLRHTPLTVSQIAEDFGFSDVCHLNKLFKRYYNHTPTTYRQGLSA